MPYGFKKLLKDDAAHGLTMSPPNRYKLTIRANALKTLNLILSLSKDEVWIFAFFSILLTEQPSAYKLRGSVCFATCSANADQIISPQGEGFAPIRETLNALMITTGFLILPVKLIGCVSWVDFFSSQLF
jgi:hypothetical protein